MQRLGRWSNGTSFGVGGLIISADPASARRRCLRRIASTSTAAEVEAAAIASPRAQEWTAGKAIRKVIVVPGKLVNIVV
jgi:leucyl-tRNA synthetase